MQIVVMAVDLLGSFTFLELFVCDVSLRVLCLFVSGGGDWLWCSWLVHQFVKSVDVEGEANYINYFVITFDHSFYHFQ